MNTLGALETRPGFEPGWRGLQPRTYPLGHLVTEEDGVLETQARGPIRLAPGAGALAGSSSIGGEKKNRTPDPKVTPGFGPGYPP